MWDVSRSATRGTVAFSPPPATGFSGNRLLDSLPRPEITKLAPYLRRTFLHRGQELATPDRPAEALYFPVDALLWGWTSTTQTERPTSIFATGRRGFVGYGDFFGTIDCPANVVALSPGVAWKLPKEALASVAGSVQSPLRRALERHVYASLMAIAYRMACNSEHNVDKRLARWLMYVMDETGKPEIALTHQQLAEVAAIRRPSVSLALSDLARRGIVRVQHGLVQVLDRDRLERESCPCGVAERDALALPAIG